MPSRTLTALTDYLNIGHPALRKRESKVPSLPGEPVWPPLEQSVSSPHTTAATVSRVIVREGANRPEG